MRPALVLLVLAAIPGAAVVACGSTSDESTANDDAGLNGSNFVIVSPLTLDKTAVSATGLVDAKVTYKNVSSRTGAIDRLRIIALPPGATPTSGPWFNFTPDDGYTRVAAGASVTLAASLQFDGSEPTGAWNVYSTFENTRGVFSNSPFVALTVGSASTDAGSPDAAADAEAGTDAGVDTGTDAGTDSGTDSGTDTGTRTDS